MRSPLTGPGLGRARQTALASAFAGLAALAVTVLAAALAAPRAEAATADIIAPQNDPHTPADGWQAGTCTTDAPTCSVATPDKFFRLAGAHPPVGFTQFTVRFAPGTLGPEAPIGELKRVRVDLPVGLSVNPQATLQCASVDDPGSCPPQTQVGESGVTASLLGLPTPPIAGLTKVPVYNLVPADGEAALFGLNLLGNDVYLRAELDWSGDYHEGFSIDVPAAPKLEPLIEGLILRNRLVFDGRAGDGTFITTPTTCYDPEQPQHRGVYSTYLLASSIEEEADPGYAFPASARPPLESPLPEGERPLGCAEIPYDPSLSVAPGGGRTGSPVGPAVAVQVPFIAGGESRASSHTRRARVTLPAGMGLNPSAANGLAACTDAQFGKGTRNPVACPPASKIGVATIETPPLPSGSLGGEVYVGSQRSRDPASGELYRIFVHVASQRYGISARLIGKVAADPASGQLTTTFDDEELGGLPQVPFSSFRLDFDDGSHAVLTSPGTCGPHRTASSLEPWSGNPAATPGDEFSLSEGAAGGPCPASLDARPFAPGFAAGSDDPLAGASRPLRMQIARGDGSQELKGVDVTLPPGLTAKLAGVTYCPPEALAAAAAKSGAAEAASPSCPASSLLGSARITAGSGPDPIAIGGRVYLAGSYAGAPLSLAIVTPATAGPFDLGSVVVRVALFLDRRTAQVRAVSDPIPHVYGGATLGIRTVAVSLDRPGFVRNPTGCEPGEFAGQLRGGGADPQNPAAFSAFPVAAPFTAHGCDRLGFKPKTFLRLFGANARGRNPRLRAVVQARPGDANIGRAAVILPPSLVLDQANLAKVCTRVQFAARACPRRSVYGHARAFTPLLDRPLEGPVYLRSSDNPLPDLVADLRGQVEVELAGRTDSVRSRIRNTFDFVPDVPVTKFVLNLRGGRKGLLVNSRHQCRVEADGRRRGKGGREARKPKPQRAFARFRAHNGRVAFLRPVLRANCGK